MVKEEEKDLVETLKSRGLSCAGLKKMERDQLRDAKKQIKDAARFRSVGFLNEAKKQEIIAKAEVDSAERIKAVRKKVCGGLR